jgi:hypothetical protein
MTDTEKLSVALRTVTEKLQKDELSQEEQTVFFKFLNNVLEIQSIFFEKVKIEQVKHAIRNQGTPSVEKNLSENAL